MCLIMACVIILFNPILVIIGWENGGDLPSLQAKPCISCSNKVVRNESDRSRENDRLRINYFFLKASTSAISATTRAAMDNPSTSGEGELEAVSDAFSSFGFS